MRPIFPALRRLVSGMRRELLLQNEYYAAQIEIYHSYLPKSWRPSLAEKAALARLGWLTS